jgi:hypothetical protein
VGAIAGTLDALGYRRIKIDGKKFYAHRLAYLYVYGRWPVEKIDHIKRIPTDNRITNLRDATDAQNAMNTHHTGPPNRTTGLRGVYYDRRYNSYTAQIGGGRNRRYLGAFKSLQEARAAYEMAAKELYGEFATLAA